MSRLLTSLDAPPSGRARPVWFDAAAYGRARLLGGGDVPWPSPAELSSFFAKIGAMFHSDAILVDLADLFAQRTAADQQLRAAMAARSRPGYALRTLLGDEQARGTAAEAVRVLAATSGPVPLVLSVPTPGRWLVAAAQQAQRDTGPIRGLRTRPRRRPPRSTAPTSCGSSPAPASTACSSTRAGYPSGELIHPEAYRPVLNVAGHYEWPVLIRTDAAAAWPHGPVPGVAVWLGSDPPTGPDEPSGRWGMVAGPDFWDGATPPAEADLVLAPVPAEAEPEAVMKQVRALA